MWAGDQLHSANVVVDSFLVLERRRGFYVLDRAPAMSPGQVKVSIESKQDSELQPSREAAVVRLYKKMIRRLTLVASHPDVVSGRVSEASAILEGLS
jgi:hypothetical protein